MELLVVLAILGILVSILIPAVSQRGQVRRHAARTVQRDAVGAPAGLEGDLPSSGGAAALKGFIAGVIVTFIVMRFAAHTAEKKAKRVSRRRSKKPVEPTPEPTSETSGQ